MSAAAARHHAQRPPRLTLFPGTPDDPPLWQCPAVSESPGNLQCAGQLADVKFPNPTAGRSKHSVFLAKGDAISPLCLACFRGQDETYAPLRVKPLRRRHIEAVEREDL